MKIERVGKHCIEIIKGGMSTFYNNHELSLIDSFIHADGQESFKDRLHSTIQEIEAEISQQDAEALHGSLAYKGEKEL